MKKKKKSQTKTAGEAKLCTTDDVKQLGKALIHVSDQYPTRFLTERDFFPLVAAYLYGRFPNVSPEHAVDKGAIDFRIGGSNPSVIELAVAPRKLQDASFQSLEFPGHGRATQLYATQNKSEIKKLGALKQGKAKKRYLLLLDLQSHDPDDLKAKYEKEADKLKIENPICVVHASRERTVSHTLTSRTTKSPEQRSRNGSRRRRA